MKKKHEEHENHERWVISYADMVTLLFALFVVLYAMGVVEMEKLKQLKQSIQFAFHIEGEGKTQKEGLYDAGTGPLKDAIELMNSQDAEMEEFISQTLPEEFEKVTGSSIDIVLTDDTITIRADLSAFFDPRQALPIKPGVQLWFNQLVKASINFTSDIRIRIEAPDVVVDRDRNNRAIRSPSLCLARLDYLRRLMTQMPKIWGDSIDLEFKTRGWRSSEGGRTWEDDAQLIVAFANSRVDEGAAPAKPPR